MCVSFALRAAKLRWFTCWGLPPTGVSLWRCSRHDQLTSETLDTLEGLHLVWEHVGMNLKTLRKRTFELLSWYYCHFVWLGQTLSVRVHMTTSSLANVQQSQADALIFAETGDDVVKDKNASARRTRLTALGGKRVHLSRRRSVFLCLTLTLCTAV